MLHPIYQIHSFQIVAPYILQIQFDDGIAKTINFRPLLTGELYSPLCELSLFNQVQLDPEVHTLVWPNGADFDPATLHDWPALNPYRNLEIAELHGESDPWEKLLTQPVAKKRLRELAQEAIVDEMNGRTTEITVTKDGRLASA